jgi:hypothetical protein
MGAAEMESLFITEGSTRALAVAAALAATRSPITVVDAIDCRSDHTYAERPNAEVLDARRSPESGSLATVGA